MSWCCTTIHNYFDCYFFSIKKFYCIVSLNHLPVDIYVFYDLNVTLLQLLARFLLSSPFFIYVFDLNIICHCYVILLLHNFFHTFFYLYQPYFYSVFYYIILLFYNIPLYSLNTLFSERNFSWLIYDSINDLEIRTSIAFNLCFHNSSTLSYFIFFFYIIHLYFLIHSILLQSFFLL